MTQVIDIYKVRSKQLVTKELNELTEAVSLVSQIYWWIGYINNALISLKERAFNNLETSGEVTAFTVVSSAPLGEILLRVQRIGDKLQDEKELLTEWLNLKGEVYYDQ